MIRSYLLLLFMLPILAVAQLKPDASAFKKSSNATWSVKGNELILNWPVSKQQKGRVIIDMSEGTPLIKAMQLVKGKTVSDITTNVDPAFVLTVGKRDLISQNGWNIFFDRVPTKPFKSHKVEFQKKSVAIISEGNRTVVRIGSVSAPAFTGDLELTVYPQSPLVNIAAVMTTNVDSTAILYDAGLTASKSAWDTISWANVYGEMQHHAPGEFDTATNNAVKYRTILGKGKNGTLAVFPAPHQYFYPLDEAFNLNFTWSGNNYRKMIDGFGLGIRQDLYGDRRFVPWFNAPPGTKQRMNFYCLLGEGDQAATLEEVKKFTHSDTYPKIAGHQRMSSHFHNEYVMNTIIPGKPVPDTPNFVKVFKTLGVDIVHLGEFHYTAHPRGPDDQRLNELNELFKMCQRYSDGKFLLLPGEEPNEFYGGHWLQFFPKPVYWIMSRAKDVPFVSEHPDYGKVYRIRNSEEMQKLLEVEGGLAWTAHPRTKGSTGYPDKYKNEPFFKSETFMGAAWKPIPADLSVDRLGIRVLDLIDDMNNWGLKKKVIAEADLFTIEPENEMYAHLNVNYLRIDKLPSYKDGWQPVIDAMHNGSFFSSTGEIVIPEFKVNGGLSGDTVALTANGNADISFDVEWTFPLNFALLVSGDGSKVYKERIDLRNTTAFGKEKIKKQLNLKGRKWVRLEVWDAAVNGAFTQTIWLK